ncbi:MAG: FtsX-like permease family protein [Acidobacteriota bacterium]
MAAKRAAERSVGSPFAVIDKLSFPALLALRYLRSTRKDAFVTFLSAVSAGGIALGVAALILALAALSGFQRALRGEVLARTPQIEAALPAGADAEAARRGVAAIPGVRHAAVVLHGRGWLMLEGRAQSVELVGYSGSLPTSFPGAAGSGEGTYIGEGLAERWGIHPRDMLDVASPRPTLTPLGPQPRLRRLAVAGTFATGRTEQDERLALPAAAAASLVGTDDVRLEISAAGLDEAVALAPAIAAALPAGSRVRTWQEINRGLFIALRLEKSVMFVAVFLIVLVAALALIADLALIIASKRSEIGILGAMGASPSALRNAFLYLGGLLAGLGVSLGAFLGVAGSWVLDRYHLVALPRRVYFLDYVPFVVHPADLAAVLALTVALALACSAYAAQRAAELSPLAALAR